MAKFIVRCIQPCWDSNKTRFYYPGDQDEIDPLNPVAKYFEGWPPGTEVSIKAKGKSGTEVIGGGIPAKDKDEPEPPAKKSLALKAILEEEPSGKAKK